MNIQHNPDKHIKDNNHQIPKETNKKMITKILNNNNSNNSNNINNNSNLSISKAVIYNNFNTSNKTNKEVNTA